MTEKINEVNLSAASKEVDDYIEKGRILPAWKEDMVELSLTDRKRFETFLLPEKQAQEAFEEVGFSTTEDPHEQDPAARALAEGARLAKLVK